MKYILVLGNIASGKMTLLDCLDESRATVVREPKDGGPFLEQALVTGDEDILLKNQAWFYATSTLALSDALDHEDPDRVIVQETGLFGIDIFSRRLFDPLSPNALLCMALSQACTRNLPTPDLVVVLLVESPLLIERIRHRARPGEENYTKADLEENRYAYARLVLDLEGRGVRCVGVPWHEFLPTALPPDLFELIDGAKAIKIQEETRRK